MNYQGEVEKTLLRRAWRRGFIDGLLWAFAAVAIVATVWISFAS